MSRQASLLKIIVIILVLVVVILAVGSVIFFDRYQKTRRAEELNQKTRRAEELKQLVREGGIAHKAGEPEKAIPLLEKALENVDGADKGKQARLRSTIDFDKYFKGSREQKIEAVNDLKAMIGDTSFGPRLRSQLLNSLVDLITATNDEQFAREVIFVGEPYQTILSRAGGDIPTATRLLYERSIEIDPTSVAYLWIAYWYAQQLVRDKNLSQEKKAEYVEAAKNYLVKGEKLIELDVAIEEVATFLPRQQRKIRPYFYRAAVSGALAIVKEYDAAKSEELFKQTLKLHEDLTDFAVFDSWLRVRFQYAATLAYLYGKTRAADIRELLKPMEELAGPNGNKYPFKFKLLNEYQQSLKKDPARIRFIDYREVILLAGLDPDFKAVMEKIGWKF